jgi:hypothetical protein
MSNTFHTGGGVYHIDIAFRDGIGGTFGHARAAGDAVFIDLHCHEKFSIIDDLLPRLTHREMSVN